MPKESGNREKWILTGYELFGHIGAEALNVERLSIMLSVNRSSFYHYFGDIVNYERALLSTHIEYFKQIAKDIKACKSFDPEIIELVYKYKIQVLFHRCLLINEANPRYIECFNKAKSFTEPLAFGFWKEYLENDGVDPGNITLFRVLRDYFLLHHKQNETVELEKYVELVKVMFPKEHASF